MLDYDGQDFWGHRILPNSQETGQGLYVQITSEHKMIEYDMKNFTLTLDYNPYFDGKPLIIIPEVKKEISLLSKIDELSELLNQLKEKQCKISN